MSNSDVLSAATTQVVFIDCRTPDIHLLIADTAPGKRMFVLDAARNGVQQIADILAADNLTDLDAIAIVAHGRAGAVDLGSTTLDRTNLADHAVALAFIGAALAPGGDLALYACNTAAGVIGRRFIQDLSIYTGVDVAAATHVVGSDAHGGSWALDASTGRIAATAPFSAAALANFQGALAIDGQIWFGLVNDHGLSNANPFGFINSDGSDRTNVGTTPTDASTYTNFDNISLDTAAGLYFAINVGSSSTLYLTSGRMSTGATIGTPISLNPNGATSDYVVNALAVDPQRHYIYLSVWGSVADSGIVRVSYDPITGVINGGSPILTGTGPSGTINPSLYVIKADNTTPGNANFVNATDFYLDVASNKLYFTATDYVNGALYGSGYPNTNGVYVVDLNTATQTTKPTLLTTSYAGDADHMMNAIAVNTAQGLIYFATSDSINDPTGTPSAIYYMPIGGGPVTLLTTLTADIRFVPQSGLEYDPISHQLIVSDKNNTATTDPSVYTLQLNAAGTAVTAVSTLFHPDEGVTGASVTGITFDALPTIGAFSGTSAQAVQLGSGIVLLNAAPSGVSDTDSGNYLASATVKITNGSGTVMSGDQLGVGATFTFNTTPQEVIVAGGHFMVSYDGATGTMTIVNESGFENTVAQYEALFAQISYKVTGTDSSTGGHPQRTVTWQVNDGANGNPTGTTNVTTTTVTVDRAVVAGSDTNTVVASASASGNVLTNDSDKDGDSFSLVAVNGSGGNVGHSLAGTYGHLTLNSDGTYTYVADNASAINSAASGSHPVDTFTYGVSDGTVTTTTQLAITIDRAPTVVADTNPTQAVAGGGNISGSVLTNDSDLDGDSLAVSAVNSVAGNVGALVDGTYGHLKLNSDGTYTYTADKTSAIDGAATGSHLSDTFNYTVSDGHGGTNATTLTLTVDRAPTVVADTNTASSGGAQVSSNVLTNDTDKDGDTLAVSAVTGGSVGNLIQGTYGNYQINADGTYTYAAGVTVGQQAAIAGAGPNPVDHITFTVSDGHGGTTSSTLDVSIVTAPVIASITASGTDIDGGGNGDLNAGHIVTLTLHMSSAVTIVGGVPTLTLNDGGTATYTGGSGSDTLTFTYTVAAGQNTPDLAVTALATNGATIQDGTSRAADFTNVPAVTGALQIDTTAAHVASVTTSGAGIDGSGNGILTVGDTVTFTVNMDETVFVSGGPATLVLNNGGIATYTGGSGSPALTFTYTVGAGENTTDLAVNSVNLNGATVATVKDLATNDADLSGAATNPGGTLEINTTAPTVASVATSGAGIDGSGNGDLDAGHTVTFTVTLDESVTVAGGTPTLTLNNGGVASYTGGSGTPALTFTYIVAAGQDTSDLAVTAANLNGATIKDAATNDADLSAAVVNPAGTLQIDTVAPTVSSVATSGTGITAGDGLLHIGDTVTFTVSLSEVVTVAGGVPTLTLSDGGVATYIGGSDTNTLTFTHTVAAGQSASDLAVTGSNFNGATVHDAAGNAVDLAGAAINPTGTLQVDGIAPTVSSVTTSGPHIDGSGNGTAHLGDTVTFTVNLSEVVTVAGGVPTLTLNDGGVATYSGGTGTNVLTFTYTVAAGQTTGDLTVTGSNLNGATVHDAAGNDADLAGAAVNPAGTLLVDGIVPTVTSVTTAGAGITAGSGNLNAADLVVFTVNLSEAVTVGGAPTLTLNDGGVATYVNGSGTSALTFVYTVSPGENTSDLAVTAANLSGGTIKDAAGNPADLSAAVTNPAGTLVIDTTSPSVSSPTTSGTGITAGTGNLNAGDVVTFTVNASEVVFVSGTPTLTLNDGGVATYTGGSGTSALTFSYTVLAGQNTGDLAVTAANLNGGTIQDAAGNTADLSAATTNPAGTLKIDTTAPTVLVSSNLTTLHAGDTATVTFAFSEAVADFALGDVLATGGSLSNLVHVGVNGVGQDIYTASFTPVATNTEVGQVQVNVSSYTDDAGNAGDASNAVNYTGDTLRPYGTATADPGSGVLMYGQTTHITLSFTEAVTFAGGTPVLTLNDGGHATFNAVATRLLGDPTKMVFDYTVGAGDSSVSTLAITGVSGGNITDGAGNASDSLATSFNGLSVQTSVITAHHDSNTVKTNTTVSTDAAHGVLANDTDTNLADHLVVSAVNGSAGGVDHTVNGSYGSLTLHADGSYSYTANGTIPGYAVVDNFSYTASNGHGQTSTSTLSVSVVNDNFAYIPVSPGSSVTTPSGNIVLDGSAGNATLTSSTTLNSQHILIGGPGDILNGGVARDTFVFAGDFGHNTINNYQSATDYIQLQQSQVGSIANVLGDLHQVGANAVLTIDADHVITITNMQVASLSAANFHLV